MLILSVNSVKKVMKYSAKFHENEINYINNHIWVEHPL